MRCKSYLMTVALLLLAWGATAGIPPTEAQRIVTEIRNQETLRTSLVGLCAVRMDGDTVAVLDPDVRLVPASNMKLLTTGLALHILGEDYRFETGMGYTGTISEGILKGDLYIIGGGDPTTGSRSPCSEPVSKTFEAWMRLLTEAGIRRIEGRVLGDSRLFSETTSQNLGWSFDDIGTYYGAGPQGLNFFENAQNLYVTPGPFAGAPIAVRPQYPETPWMRYAVHATTGPARSANTLYYVNTVLGPYGEVAGSFPLDRRAYTLECSNLYGAYTCAYAFYSFLQSRGIEAQGGYGDVTPQGELRTELQFAGTRPAAAPSSEIVPLGSTRSATLSEIVRETNGDSNNFYAETLMRMIALRAGAGTDQDACQRAVESELNALGLRTDGTCQQVDGSGLSRKNYVSPSFFVQFLRKMATLPVWDPFFASLPVPGVKGTLEMRFSRAPQEFKDRIHMKSGSMNGVRCFSGYILASDGDPDHTIVFSLLTNNCTATSARATAAIDGIIEALAGEN